MRPSFWSLFIAFAIIIVCAFGISVLINSNESPQKGTVPMTYQATGTPMQLEVVTTDAAKEKGLGGRTSIADNYGMLFVFTADQSYGFWMKDMLVPIDIIWLSADGTIITIADSVPADSYPKVYTPAKPARYVLEVKAGGARAHGWKVGERLPLPAPYGTP